jgi:RHS repeat-associated protein
MDEANGLQFVRARYYAPALGRFVSPDLLAGSEGNTQSLDRYVYALNNPVGLVDVTGLSAAEGSAYSGQGPSDEMHCAYFGAGHCWRSEEAHQAYLKAVGQWQTYAQSSARAEEYNRRVIEGWYGTAKVVKTTTDWTMRGADVLSLWLPPLKAAPLLYDVGTTAVEAGWVFYEKAVHGELDTQQAVKTATSATLDIIGEGLENLADVPIGKAVIKGWTWVHEDIADWTIGRIFQ